MKANPNITTTALAEFIKVSRRAIAKQIAILKEERKLKRVGPDKGGHWEVINDESSQKE
jgi:ATP-dependent DNA helicase RecG